MIFSNRNMALRGRVREIQQNRAASKYCNQRSVESNLPRTPPTQTCGARLAQNLFLCPLSIGIKQQADLLFVNYNPGRASILNSHSMLLPERLMPAQLLSETVTLIASNEDVVNEAFFLLA